MQTRSQRRRVESEVKETVLKVQQERQQRSDARTNKLLVTDLRPTDVLVIICSFLDWSEHVQFTHTCKIFCAAAQSPTSYCAHRGELTWGTRRKQLTKKALTKLVATGIKPRKLVLYLLKCRTKISTFGILSGFQPTSLHLSMLGFPEDNTTGVEILTALGYSQLTELYINNFNRFRLIGLASVCPRLEKLTFEDVGAKCDLLGIGKLPLKELYIDQCFNDGPRPLYSSLAIQAICISFPMLHTLETGLTRRAIRQLHNLQHLTDLNLIIYEGHEADFSDEDDLYDTLVQKGRLLRLAIDMPVSYTQLQCLGKLPLLKLSAHAGYGGNGLEMAPDIDWLRQCTTLRELDLRICQKTIEDKPAIYTDLSALSSLSNLVKLELGAFPTYEDSNDHESWIDGACLHHLAKLTRLEHLCLSRVLLNKIVIRCLVPLSIAYLDIHMCDGEEAITSVIGEMQHLQELYLFLGDKWSRNNAWIRPLLLLPNLHTLGAIRGFRNMLPLSPEVAKQCLKFRNFEFMNRLWLNRQGRSKAQ